MIQWLKTRLGGDEDEQEKDTPPKPKHHTKTTQTTVWEATIEYRNGDTETFECYGKGTNEDTVKFQVEVSPYCCFSSPKVRLSYNSRYEHYEVLAREPEMEKVRDETWRIEWSTEWNQDRWGNWEESVDRDSIEMERIE